MRRGDFASAWRISDRILEQRVQAEETCSHWPRHLQFVWRGQALENRRVLVRCYHGLGDTLQFVRFIAPLRRAAGEVVLWAQPALLSLVGTAAGVDRYLPLHEGAPEVDFDVDIELMEIPHALRIDLNSLPRTVPYLHPAAAPLNFKKDERLCVGIAWQAGAWNPLRSLTARTLAALRAIPNVRFFSLQFGAGMQIARLLGAEDLSCRDIAVMAARMQHLDLVISIDTMVAHLAGALGLQTWTLLHADCDWRWMRERDDSPWYPTMRIFRQREAGVWRPVMNEVRRELERLAASSRPQKS